MLQISTRGGQFVAVASKIHERSGARCIMGLKESWRSTKQLPRNIFPFDILPPSCKTICNVTLEFRDELFKFQLGKLFLLSCRMKEDRCSCSDLCQNSASLSSRMSAFPSNRCCQVTFIYLFLKEGCISPASAFVLWLLNGKSRVDQEENAYEVTFKCLPATSYGFMQQHTMTARLHLRPVYSHDLGNWFHSFTVFDVKRYVFLTAPPSVSKIFQEWMRRILMERSENNH